MELHQRSISHRRGIIFLLIMFLLFFVLVLFLVPRYAIPFLIILLVLLALLQHVPRNTILICDTGISCLGAKNTLWSFDWDEIHSFTISRRERVKNVELKVTSHRHMDILTFRQVENQLYFQLDKKARKALYKFAPDRLEAMLK